MDELWLTATAQSCAHVVQPLLDVILFTRSLSRSMGYKGQLGLYLYYLISAGALRQLSPPLALMTAQESSLSGGFRAAHQVPTVPHLSTAGCSHDCQGLHSPVCLRLQQHDLGKGQSCVKMTCTRLDVSSSDQMQPPHSIVMSRQGICTALMDIASSKKP